MANPTPIVLYTADGKAELWNPTILSKICKDEKYLDNTLANNPELMGLESRRTGIRGPFKVFSKLQLKTPQGRSIVPDIVILSASGHIIVVEVKVFENTQLKNREVIAQIIDYAACLSALSKNELAEIFIKNIGTASANWEEFINASFPDESDNDELAEILMERFQTGHINLVIACDKAPTGLSEIIRGIATQSALEFELDLIEVIPHVKSDTNSSVVIFVPRTRLSTEIVARTSVTVSWSKQDERPNFDIRVMSLEDIEENIKMVNQDNKRAWDYNSFMSEIQSECGEVQACVSQQILEWGEKQNLNPNWKKEKYTNATVMLTLPIAKGNCKILSITSPSDGRLGIKFGEYLKHPPLDSYERRRRLLDDLNSIPKVYLSISNLDEKDKTPSILLSLLKEPAAFEKFTEAMERFLAGVG